MKVKVENIVRQVLCLDDDVDILNVHRAGGMTNLNYFVRVGSEDYIVRLPGHGTEELVNRRTEKENLQFATALGINPELVYFNIESGLKITRKVKRARTLTPKMAKHHQLMQAVAQVFNALHYTDRKMGNEFELFDLMGHYKKLVHEVNPLISEKVDKLAPEMEELKRRFLLMDGIRKVPCHVDPTFSNFLIAGEEDIFLIDWEYSGMFDPLWDVASFSLESGLTENEERIFLNAYFHRETAEEELQRILMHKIFQDYLWSLWTFFKDTQGDDFGSYGMYRLKRAEEHIHLFNETYNRTEVG